VHLLIKKISTLNQLIGQIAAWLIFVMMLISFTVVILRYGFGLGSIALQEAVSYCHAFAFLLGAAYTLEQDEHVRVDIFYHRFSENNKAWVNAFGTLVFLMPFCCFLLFSSWHMFESSLAIRESSPEPGGIPFLYLFKGLIPLAMFLLLLQALALLFQSTIKLVVRQGPK
jgi:TRAP-type mannitol/chloroaromatic compound transport system permease small subunit